VFNTLRSFPDALVNDIMTFLETLRGDALGFAVSYQGNVFHSSRGVIRYCLVDTGSL
jgi:hypothetical protein